MNHKIFILLVFLLIMPKINAELVNMSDLTLEQKVAQMFIVRGDKFDPRLIELGVGGIFLDRQKTFEQYRRLIKEYQNKSEIKLFVATDLEGYWNPFPFFKSKNFGEIENPEQAKELGQEHAGVLKELGFNLDFSPVVEAKNKVWPGRSFNGTREQKKQKIAAYIKGLQSRGIIATAKHYPGGNLIKNPHWFKVKAKISNEDLEYFQTAIDSNVSAIMVGHSIVQGSLNSNRRQSSVSPEVISHLRKDFNGLIITDDINMWGLRWSYLFRTRKLYLDSVIAGNDIILDSGYRTFSFKKVERAVDIIVKAVEEGEIPEQRIDESVKRILKAKGYDVLTK